MSLNAWNPVCIHYLLLCPASLRQAFRLSKNNLCLKGTCMHKIWIHYRSSLLNAISSIQNHLILVFTSTYLCSLGIQTWMAFILCMQGRSLVLDTSTILLKKRKEKRLLGMTAAIFILLTRRATLPYSDKRKQLLTNHPNLRKWCF